MIVRVMPPGKDAAGLARYLFGPGKANEHTNQRVVAGTAELHAEWGGSQLSMAEATHLGRVVEASWRRQYAPDLVVAGRGSGGISRSSLRSGPDALPGQAHVFHAALSLRPDATPLSDEQWGEVAREYVRGMGFTDSPGKPDAAWFAAHHGSSAEGNDHIHIAVCATRRDGSTVDLSNTGRRSQVVRREALEQLPYVDALHDQNRAENTQTLVGYTAAEHNLAKQKAGHAMPPDRVRLQRIVRAAAADSKCEAEFINALVNNPGVELEPARWSSDRTQVTGYTVSIDDGARFPASKLAGDLTLAQLRPHWNETPDSAATALDLWRGDDTLLDPLNPTADVSHELRQAASQLEMFNTSLEAIPADDLPRWSHASASLAGATAVLATGRHPAFGGAGEAADVLARHALVDAAQPSAAQRVPGMSPTSAGRPAPHVPTGLGGAEIAARHIQLALRSATPQQAAGWFAVAQQLRRTAAAIRTAREARGEVHAARALLIDVDPRMVRLADALQNAAGGHHGHPNERVSERMLRERSAAATPPAVDSGELTQAAKHAQTAAAHAGSQQPTKAPAPAGPTSQPANGREGPGQSRVDDDRTPPSRQR